MELMLTRRFHAVLFGVMVLLMSGLAVGTVDYRIASLLLDRDSTWARFFEIVGELPGSLGLLLSGLILYGARQRDGPLQPWMAHGLALGWVGGVAYAALIARLNYIRLDQPSGVPFEWRIAVIFVAGCLSILGVVTANRWPRETWLRLKRPAQVLLLLAAVTISLTTLIKILCGRPRPSSVANLQAFHYWYEIAGPAFSAGYKSFPSGHAAQAFTGLAYLLFAEPLGKSNLRGWAVLALTWGILVAVSRVVLGAHYLSDVLAGAYLTIVLFSILSHLVYRAPIDSTR